MECHSTECNGTRNTPGRIVKRVAISASVIAVGLAGMMGLAAMKTPPAEVDATERPIVVNTRTVVEENVQVIISGYGEVRPLEVVTLAPEVAGRIVEIHPRLRTGEIIAAGETLFRIDPRDYQASLAEASATVVQLKAALSRLATQQETDQQRLAILNRNRDLAKTEYRRIKRLLDKDKVGTQSGVDAAEQAANNAANMADMLAQAVSLYPIQIKEARGSLAAAEARRDLAAAKLNRCTVTAPFDGRITRAALEREQYVTPGYAAVTMANDTILEIHVPLDSRDARDWLRFSRNDDRRERQWFDKLEPVAVRIRWTEAPDGHVWQGRLHRVVGFDTKTRTVTVAVRVSDDGGAETARGTLPLVEGMFCIVDIPGRVLEGVVRLPRYAVSHEGSVYMAVDGRLQTRRIGVARIQGDETLVASGLAPGESVIVTRLVEPLENALLKVTDTPEG